MISLSRTWAVVKHDARILRRDPGPFITFTVMPLIVMAFVKPAFRFAVQAQSPGANGAEQAVPGITVMFVLFLVNTVGFVFFREYGWGTWDRVRASHARSAEIMLGKFVMPLVQAATQLTVLLGVGGLLYHLHVRGSVFAMALVAGAFSVAVIALGMVLVAICRSILQLTALANLGVMLLAGLGGAIAPSQALPAWARAIAPAVPSYWAMRGFRSVVLDGGGTGAVLLPAGVLLLFAAGFLIVVGSKYRLSDQKMFYA